MFEKNKIGNKNVIALSFVSLLIGLLSSFIAKILLLAIKLFTNIFYFQRISFETVQLTLIRQNSYYIFIPVIGGLFVGLIARFGSKGIRGHGIPEAMEKVLYNDGIIPRRITFLKPLASAIAIGSGGPFGAEGPIIATGSALGAWIARFKKFKPHERKVLLAAGAAAGMTAIFGTPLAAVFICIELLLFEFSSRSFIPVLCAVAVAYTMRALSGETDAVFFMPLQNIIYDGNLFFYLLLGIFIGSISSFVSKIVFLVEDAFEHLPIHWMYWPAIGGLVVGIIGYVEPRTLGVGYENITNSLNNKIFLSSAISLVVFKFISWAISLGSGTSGGTLAPLLTFGSSIGLIWGLVLKKYFPNVEINLMVCALVGMSAMFAGATRAILTSTLFAIEATGAHFGLIPVIIGNCGAYVASIYLMEETIMTMKLSRNGKHVPADYFPIKNKLE